MSGNGSGWLVVCLAPAVCFAFGQLGGGPGWRGFLFVWAVALVCAAVLARWGRPGVDGRPRIRLRRPRAQALARDVK